MTVVLISRAWRDTDLKAFLVDFLEAHDTGRPVQLPLPVVILNTRRLRVLTETASVLGGWCAEASLSFPKGALELLRH